jgi:hypothetical protein
MAAIKKKAKAGKKSTVKAKATAWKGAAKAKPKVMKGASRGAGKPAAMIEGKGLHVRAVRDAAIEHLRYSHTQVMDFGASLDQLATSQAAHIPNHWLWTLGHLTMGYRYIISTLRGEAMSNPAGARHDYKSLFHGTPMDDAGAYPSLAEVTRNYHAARDELIRVVEDADVSRLLDAPKGKAEWVTSNLDGLHKAAWHNGWHVGQIALLRKGLGQAPKW